jgi:monoamine oxidase/SAM-dependent methyltransferase
MRSVECQGFGPGEKQSESFRVAIVGGGPGGLFSAWHLEHKAADACKITIFEADERPGGKLFTGSFAGAGPYEAGVAEIYDYSALGPDPLRELIEKDLGLKIKHIEGGPCVLDGHIIQNVDELGSYFGEAAQRDAAAFRARCAELYPPQHYYQSLCERDQAHPWTNLSGETLLRREIPNYMARRYIRAMCHSDVAAGPHLTNGVNLLKNVLMDVDGYLNIFAVVEGNGQIAARLVEELTSELRLGSQVRSIEKLDDGTYRLEVGSNGGVETVIADYVILALPLTALSIIKWRSEEFQRAMAGHFTYFDRPAHYLRATLLFERPFWREHLNTAWWMMDAFDGCCVYDEGARLDLGQWGALGFLIAGNAALGLANLSDEQIERLCLDALPPALAHGRQLVVDRRIHRWLASVNAIPGGHPVRSRYQNHRPDPDQLPGVYIVGDYMFDATINGALDSADAATDMLLADILERRQSLHRRRQATVATQAGIPASFAVALELLFASANIPDLMRTAWGTGPKTRVLLLGSASGKYVEELRELGYDAYGFEWRPSAYAGTARAFESFNRLGSLPELPFPDDHFDVVLDAALCCLPRSDVPAVLRELRRITKSGLLFGSRTTDLSIELIDRHSLLEGVQTLASRWDWSEMLFGAGFVHTLMDPARMHDTWTSAQSSGAGPGRWYEDAESLLYCVYSVAPMDWEEMQKDEKPTTVGEHDGLRVTVDETK